MRQTANKTTKKPDALWAHLQANHSAIRHTLDHDLPQTLGDRPIANGRDFSQVHLNSTVFSGLCTNLAQSCPFIPQRCPFGGVCHTCPPRFQSMQSVGIQRKATNNDKFTEVPPIVHEVLRSSGQPLDNETRAVMEPRFGHDFSQVRVHTDAKAAESARWVNSSAYTVGRDVVFGAGYYAPHTKSGRGLLGHELTHVVQQGNILPQNLKHLRITSSLQLEHDAESIAQAISLNRPTHQTTVGTPIQPTLQKEGEPIDVDLEPVTPEQQRRADASGIDLPEVSEETWEAVGGEPLNKVGRSLSEQDRENAALAADVQAPTGPLGVLVQGAKFVLHDTASNIGATRIRELQGLGRRSAGFGPAAYVPTTGSATIAHTPLFGARRPTATEFEKGEDIMSEASRNTRYRHVWQSTSQTRRLTGLNDMLAAQGSTGREASRQRSAAISELNAASGNVHSAGIWTVEDICQQVTNLIVALTALSPTLPNEAILISAGLADSANDAQNIEQECVALAPLTGARTGRIGSSVNVEVIQQGGSQCRTTGALTRLPDYTASQYHNVMQLYLRAALEAGQFPEVTTHFLIDKNIGDHCDPRCFNINTLYELIRTVMHHHRGSIYGIVPNYGTGAANNVWWNNTVCGGAPPT